ncbi:MAG: beta strand repeat-containing protein [Actinomycetota bacterium]
MTSMAGVLVRPRVPAELMRAAGAAAAALLLTVSIGQVSDLVQSPPETAATPTAAPTEAVAQESLGSLPMAWVANAGQTDAQVRYEAHGLGYSAFLTDEEAVLRFDGAVVRLGFEGARSAPSLRAEAPLAATVSTFVGSDPDAWQAGAPTSEVVRYEELWPGIDVTFRGTGRRLEWDLHVAAGADPAAAGIAVAGADRIEVDGPLAAVAIGDGELPLAIPAVWQTLGDGSRVARDASWQLDGSTLSVVPVEWDTSLPGVIDPTLEWSTFVGGGHGGDGDDAGKAIAIDASGNTYLAGATGSTDFPTTAGAIDASHNGDDDVFVTKLNASGSALVYSTLLGGSARDIAYGIAVDASGNAYITGETVDSVTDYPATSGAFDTSHNGSSDAFATKLDATGTALVYSTLLGGAGLDLGRAISVDSAGASYVTGFTEVASPGFPTTAGAYDTTYNGGTGVDVFVTKVEPAGASLSYSTLLGGGATDIGQGIAVDASGAAFVTGVTANAGTDYPTTAGAFDTTHGGGDDAFATKLNAAGSALSYSTLLGGAGSDSGNAIAIDSAGDAFITGTAGSGYPTTVGAYDISHSGSTDVFVTRVVAAGSSLAYSTFVGTGYGYAIAIDGSDNAYVTGHTLSSTFPTTAGAYDTTLSPSFGDSFAAKVNSAGSALVYSTFLGGAGRDYGQAIAVDSAGSAFIGGTTGSTDTGGAPNDYPTTAGAWDTVHDDEDAFVTKLNTTGSALDFSTLVGGSDGTGVDSVKGVAADASGVYVTGSTASTQFPTTAGAYDTTYNGSTDVFVAKLDIGGSALLYGTVIGGSAFDSGNGIAVDSSGNAYVTGHTGDGSTDYPTTGGAFATTHNGVDDVFISKLNPTGTALLYSTLLGGSQADIGYGIAVDSAGAAFVTGSTIDSTTDLPTTAGAYNTTHNGGTWDAFVTKLDPSGGSLSYGTMLGGAAVDIAYGIAVDGSGSAYITGYTNFTDFPTTAGAFDVLNTGGSVPDEGFVTKLDPGGSAIVYSSMLGGSNIDKGRAVAVDGDGYAYVTGETYSSDFPITAGAFDTSFGGGIAPDAFVTRLDPDGEDATYSSYLGGSGFDYGRAIAADSDGNAYVAGYTNGTYPTTAGAFDTTHNGSNDATASKLSATGGLIYSTYLGGAGNDFGYGIAISAGNRVAIGGSTASTSFPTTAGAFDVTTGAGATAGFTTLIDFTPFGAPSACKNSTVAGAEIGMYPAQPGAQSALRVSCTFNSAVGTSMVSAKYTIHDFDVVLYHNGSARTVTNTASIPAGATTFTLASFAGTGAWVNRPITAVGVAGLAPRTFVKSISGAGLVTLNRPATAAIPAGTTFKIDNTIARSVTDGATTASSTTLTSATANFTAADTGLSVTGTNVPANTTATFVDATTITLSNPATATSTSQVITLGSTLLNTTTRVANDAANTSATVISSPAAKFRPDDVGLRVTGPGIPANTFILSVSGSNATTTGGLTVNAAPQTIVIGEPSATAPTGTDTAANQSMQLDLSPSLIAGTDACSNSTPEVVSHVARWQNPGSFMGTGLSNTQPPGTKAIGQLFFDTVASDFSAFVIERPLLVAGDPIGSTHYDIVFPFMPAASSMCASTTSPGLSFSLGVHAQTASQAALVSGAGKPSSAQLRSVLHSATGGYASTAYVMSDDPAVTFGPASEFNRLCLYPDDPASVTFQCGNG